MPHPMIHQGFAFMGMALLLVACSKDDDKRMDELRRAEPASQHPPVSVPVPGNADVASSSQPNFAQLVGTNGAAVVNVEVVQKSKESFGRRVLPDDPLATGAPVARQQRA